VADGEEVKASDIIYIEDPERLIRHVKIEVDLVYLKAVYVAHSGPETPSWAILEPRMRKYLEYIYSKE
jgi:hypothetical protein